MPHLMTGQQVMSNTDLVTPAAAPAIRPPVQWRDIVAFSALAYALSWGWWAPMVWPYLSRITLTGPLPNVVEGGSVRVPLGMFGPLIAAIDHASVCDGRRAERNIGASSAPGDTTLSPSLRRRSSWRASSVSIT